MLLLQLLLGISSPAHIDLVMRDLAPPWPSPAKTGGGGIGDGINANSSSSSSPMRFTALHVTMIFIAILLCVIICAIPWDNIKCNGSSSSSSRSGGGGHDNQNPLDENAAAPHDEEQQQQQHPQQQQASGLSKAMIKSFQLVRYGSSSLREKAESENAGGGGGGGGGCWAECMICLSDFRNGQMVRILPHCTHGFHKKCIEQWLHSHTSCPICRNVLLVLDSPGKPSTTSTAVSHQHPNHAAPPEALVRQHQQLQPQEQVVVDLDRVEEEEDDADADADAASVEHHDHSVYRTYIGISD